ncbi:30S ribosomal protein S13 [Candidatus Roizmanbacteria bacterium CG_4_9_14_3_um_filter_33_18]|uniref:Small ribosomal subunit protein uS13 n=3 Tax=Candidatus Roizmaniibacteriota TaxID=1752723 RepID=A0A2M7U8I7_9BACT|nr:MAG: 30S ribosomal protein S13 [Candidatus Roizmanbacteria bacterium CG22_combo_CG10-13_8_21_14_all_34_12]PIZ67546.1 MAG: 30S ribosomal protein S13 [Candidatus Roizmanbacteria bacterium CG_4_10_14_0_2_um_filter_33_96]PJA55454.1 MAG: 30S ribosomal protein S13 [Candidatus Roizmanbacteria bacterium CG_4_9_14_3_um_filter_33_18]
MARMLGVTLPDEKRIDYALTTLYGIGWTNVKAVLSQTGVDANKKVKEVSEEDFKKILEVIETNYKVEGYLREAINDNIKRLRDIGSYRGIRHVRGLPVDGQRTKSNARTKRGKRKTVGALKKEMWAKLEQNKTAEAVKTKETK